MKKNEKNECGRSNTSEPFRSQAKIRHNRSRFTLPFIPFYACARNNFRCSSQLSGMPLRSLSKVNVDGWRFSHINFTISGARFASCSVRNRQGTVTIPQMSVPFAVQSEHRQNPHCQSVPELPDSEILRCFLVDFF